MKRALRIILWIAGCLVGLTVAVSIAADLYTRTASFHNLLREQAVAFFDRTYKGRLAVGSVEGSLWSGLTLRDVTLSHDGRPVMTVARVRIEFAPLRLPAHEIALTRIVAVRPMLVLRPEADGEWSLLGAVKERHPSPPSDFSVLINALVLEEAEVQVTDANGRGYALEQAKMGAGIFVPASGGVEIDVRYLDGAVRAPYLPDGRVEGSFAYRDAGTPPGVTVRELELETHDSLLRLSGVAANLNEPRIDFNLALVRLAPTDLARLAPTVRIGAPVTGEIRVAGVPADLALSGQLAAGAARIEARAKADVSGKSPVYSADVTFAGVDLAALAERTGLSATVGGRCHLAGTGMSAANLGGDIDLTAGALGWRAYRAGDLHLTAALKNQSVTYSGQITGPAGGIDSHGTLGLGGELSYDLEVQARNFRPRRLGPALPVPSAALNFTAALQGRGIEPASATATIRMRWMRSRAERVTITGGDFEGNLARGRLDAHATMAALGSTIAVAGRARIAGETAFDITYEATSPDLAPWMELAGYRGGGAMKLSGSAAGNLSELRTRGGLRLGRAMFKGDRAGAVSLDYDLAGRQAQWLHAGRVTLAARDVEAGARLQAVNAQVDLSGRGRAIKAHLQATARDEQARGSALGVDIDYSPDMIAARIQSLELGLPNGLWRLPRPADIDYGRRRLEVRNFVLRSGHAEVGAYGVVAAGGVQDFHLSAQGLRIAELGKLAGSDLPVKGRIGFAARIAGTAAEPVIAANLNLTELETGGVRYAGLRARLDYAAGVARLNAALEQDASHNLRAEGLVPVAIGWSHGWKMKSSGDADIRIFSSGLNVAFAGGLAPAVVRAVSGTLTMDVRVRGPLTQLQPQGVIDLRSASFVAVPVNVRITDLSAAVSVGADRITLTALSAHADKDGVISAHGVMMLSDMVPQQVSIEARAANWPAIHTAQYQAYIDGTVRCDGPLRHLTAGGSIAVLRAELKPELRFMNAGATRVDRTIVVIRPNAAAAATAPRPGASVVNAIWRNLTIALSIAIHRDTWVRQDKSAVEIRGDLRVTKAPGHGVELAGTINSVRGVVQVVNQSFNLSRAQVVFTGGGKINPSLDIVAQRQLPTYIIDVMIQGTADKPTLTLQSQPELPQSEILSLLMFGGSVGNLNSAQKQSLQQQALSVATGFAAGQLAESVAGALGLQGFGAGGAGVGGYVAPRLFISAGQDTSGTTQGGQAAIDYNLTRQLDLRTSTSTVNGNQIELRWQKNY